MALKDYLPALGGGGSVAVIVDWIIGTGDIGLLLVEFLLGNVEILLSLAAVTSGRLAPEISWLPADLLNKVVIALAVLYALVLVGRLVRNWKNDK